MKMKRSIRKPFSEMSKTEKIAEAHAAIGRLSHPHNRYSPSCQQAIRRWQATLRELETTPEQARQAYNDRCVLDYVNEGCGG
jgi:hypothetical protein